MTRRQVTQLLGLGITIVTLTNFIPALTTHSEGHRLLFGLFIVSTFLVTLHFITGLLALVVGLFTPYSRWFLLLAGVVFAFVAIAGFVSGHTVLGLFPVNTADNLLHTIFAIVFFGASLSLKDE